MHLKVSEELSLVGSSSQMLEIWSHWLTACIHFEKGIAPIMDKNVYAQ